MPRTIPIRDRRPTARRRYDKPGFAEECPGYKDKNPSPFGGKTAAAIVERITKCWPRVEFRADYPLARELTEAAEWYGRLEAAERTWSTHNELRGELKAVRRLARGADQEAVGRIIDLLSARARGRLRHALGRQRTGRFKELREVAANELRDAADRALAAHGVGENNGPPCDTALHTLVMHLDRIYTEATGLVGTVSTRDEKWREGPFIEFLVICARFVLGKRIDGGYLCRNRLWQFVERQRGRREQEREG